MKKTQIELDAHTAQKVRYTVSVPRTASPGGHYFTLFASMTMPDGRQIRLGETVYVTIEGKLIKTSTIEKSIIPSWSFGGNIPFSFDVRDTGNTHFTIYVSGELHGVVSSSPSSQEAAHIVLPGKVRSITGSIPSPFFPGIYEASVGYRVEDGQRISKTHYIVYTPLWFWLLLAGIAGLCWLALKKRWLIGFWRRRYK